MADIVSLLTDNLVKLSKKGFEQLDGVKLTAMRLGIIIQTVRAAVQRSHIYLYSGTPHFFNGKIYVPITPDEFKGCIYEVMLRSNLTPADFVSVEKVQRIALQAVQSKPLNVRKDIIVFENCVLCLGEMIPSDEVEVEVPKKGERPEGMMRKHSPELAQTTMCHFDYDPDAECPKWRKFIGDVLDNVQMRMVLQEFIGCMFIDRRSIKFESMLILIGRGSNGKGVVSETVRGIIGSDSMTAFGLDSLLVGGEALHNVAKMNGMRVNWCTEIQALQAGRYSDRLKTLVSGEPVECRQIYGNPFTACDIPVMAANCNSLPPLEDKSYGMQRRFVIIRFDKVIPVEKQDKRLLKKLVPEYPGIFNWILEGRQRFIDQHFAFTKCKAIDDAVKMYVEAANNVEEFCMMRTYKPEPTNAEDHEPYFMPHRSLYDDYARWCVGAGVRPYTVAAFGREMTTIGFKKSRRANGYVYHIYGERAFWERLRLRKDATVNKMIEGGKIVNGQQLYGGIIYDVGEESASRQWHIDPGYLRVMRNRGYLFDVWRYEFRQIFNPRTGRFDTKRVHLYDHYRLGKRLEAMGIYDTEGKISLERDESIRAARSFNEEMKQMGEPFRKFTGKGMIIGQGGKSIIWVDPDWEYTEQSSDVLKDRYFKQLSKKKKEDEVEVTSSGKAHRKTDIEKVREAITQKLYGDPDFDDEELGFVDIDMSEFDPDDESLNVPSGNDDPDNTTD